MELTFWCDCKGCYEAFTGKKAPANTKTGGASMDDCYASLPTSVDKNDNCIHCGYVAQARRLTPEQYEEQVAGGLPKKMHSGNRPRAIKVLQIKASTGTINKTFESSSEAEAAGIRSVRHLIRTGRKCKNGYIYRQVSKVSNNC